MRLRTLGTRFALGLFWLLHFLPLALLARIGHGFGNMLYVVARDRRRVALTNLRLCFPQWSEAERKSVARRHFRAFARAALERGILWWAAKERILRIVRIEGLEHWQAVADRPVIWLAPHFVGIDMGGTRLAAEYRAASMFTRQKNPVLDAILYHGRTRFVMPRLVSRQEGLRPLVRVMREGLPFYYLPDMDFGARDSVFVPFFGVPTATITGLSRIARVAGASVVPVITRQLQGGQGYILRFYPAWENFPTDDAEADTRRMNAFIEERVLEMPDQYHWVHKRFKTRPPGAEQVY
ncbi:MAG TPA: lipid A biosynthesis acyltransferase [Burkholderiales bacterium]|nr:lipid A biosynthesis acyltransferase [Burkholderiales bacterium]